MKRFKRLKIICGILLVVFLGLYCYLQANYYPPILMYHYIDEDIARGNTLAVSPDVFASQMAFLKRHNYKVVSLEELLGMINRGGELERNLVVVTFDDGYKNNLSAAKILKEYNFAATIFMVIDWIGKPGYLTRADLNWITSNSPVSFGSHTLNHRYLPEVPVQALSQEIAGSKLKAKQEYGLDLLTLAYPVGGFSLEVLEEARQAGYLGACTTNRGFLRELDIYALRRIKITNRDLGIRLWAKLTGFYNVLRRLKPPY
ncbi:MAG: polysaccharide deacetylase family protein [Candidatus Omnitrophota bacterium]